MKSLGICEDKMTTKIDLVNEAADWSEKAGNGVIATYLREYKDLLEAREKAEPVAVTLNANATHLFSADDYKVLTNLPAGTKLYAELPTTPTGVAEQKLASSGVFAGVEGLRGLLESDAFWSVQPYGTRLHFGEGITEYLHRDVLRAAVELLDNNQQTQAPVVDERAEFEKWFVLQDRVSADVKTWALLGWQAHAKLGQTTDKACSAVVPDEKALANPSLPFSAFSKEAEYVRGWNDCRAEMLKGEK